MEVEAQYIPAVVAIIFLFSVGIVLSILSKISTIVVFVVLFTTIFITSFPLLPIYADHLPLPYPFGEASLGTFVSAGWVVSGLSCSLGLIALLVSRSLPTGGASTTTCRPFKSKWLQEAMTHRRGWSTVTISVAAAILVLRLITFHARVALVGVPPPDLGYNISGIAYYSLAFALPVLLVVACLMSGLRNRILVLSALVAGMSGILSLSKASIVIVVAPLVAVLLYLGRFRSALGLSVFALLSIRVVETVRPRVYAQLIDGGREVPNLLEAFSTAPWLDAATLLPITPILLLSRIDNVANFSLAVDYPLDVGGGSMTIAGRLVASFLMPPLDSQHSSYFAQVAGNPESQVSIPDSFAAGGGVMSWVITLVCDNPMWFLLAIVWFAALLLILEYLLRKIVDPFEADQRVLLLGSALAVPFLLLNFGNGKMVGALVVLIAMAAATQIACRRSVRMTRDEQ